MNHRNFLLILLLSIATPVFAQLGGSRSYLSTELVNSARIAALGGKFISVWDSDIDMAYINPALLDSTDMGQLSMNYGSIFQEVGNATVSYGHHVSELGTFAATLSYLDYGEFSERDEFNTELGRFNAADYLIAFGFGREIDSLFRIGVNLKFIHSQLEQYSSSAVALDIGGTYRSRDQDFTIGLVARNLGTAISTYTEGNREKLPFAIDLGLTKRLSKSPLRLSLTFSDLQKWDLSYTDPADIGRVDPLTGEEIPVENADFGEKILLHVNGSMEFLLGENFHLRLGYDFRRRNELSLSERPGGAGLSWGLGLKIARMRLNYGRVVFNQAGATNHIGLALRWSDFRKAS